MAATATAIVTVAAIFSEARAIRAVTLVRRPITQGRRCVRL